MHRVDAVRGFAARTAEGCFLLRTLAAHHLARLAARCDEPTRTRLLGLKLRDWASGADGAAVAAQLISVLVTEACAGAAPAPGSGSGLGLGLGSGAEDLAASLSAGCGAWFRDEDRTFYRASGLLQRAEAAAGAERASLAREALRLMMQARSIGFPILTALHA